MNATTTYENAYDAAYAIESAINEHGDGISAALTEIGGNMIDIVIKNHGVIIGNFRVDDDDPEEWSLHTSKRRGLISKLITPHMEALIETL